MESSLFSLFSMNTASPRTLYIPTTGVTTSELFMYLSMHPLDHTGGANRDRDHDYLLHHF
jgi:hypothetical protein